MEGPDGRRFWGRFEVLFESVLDLGFWSYTTVVAQAVRPFEAHMADVESIELRWVPVHEVSALPLHPGFADAWPQLRARLTALSG